MLKRTLFGLNALAFFAAAAAQEPISQAEGGESYDENAWIRVPFAERSRLFLEEGRDSEWADSMEEAIRAKVSELDRPLAEVVPAGVCALVSMCRVEMPSVRTESVECRATLCRIELHWPPGTTNPIIGQQLSFLYGIGIDHQGEIRTDDDGIRFQVEMFARRRT